jgi:hypothetical protein
MHLTDEDLILHFYGDGPMDREAEIDAHLRSCAACGQVWAELRQTLAFADAATVPEPGPGFERVMWAKVQQRLETPDDLGGRSIRPARSWLRGAWLLPAAAALVAIVAGTYGWRHFMTPQEQTAAVRPVATPAVASADAKSRERVLLTALDDQFQQSEMLLVEIMNAPESTGELGFERDTAGDLLDSSRLYRMTAQQNGDVRLSQMLEELEGVLIEIAHSPERMDKKDFNSLRARIDGADLLFKVRAVSTQIQDRRKSLSTE